MNDNGGKTVRRYVRSRETVWAGRGAEILCKLGVRPNQISVAGAVFALSGGLSASAVCLTGGWLRAVLLIFAAFCIQGRLLCNLFDGMVAIEGGHKTKSGEIFNDFPDRLSDTFLLSGTGIAAGTAAGAILGLVAALAAMLTAYVRVLAGASGAEQRFLGPMAKQHRMAVLTVTLLVSAAVSLFCGDPAEVICAGLIVVIIGSAVTVIRRLTVCCRELEAK